MSDPPRAYCPGCDHAADQFTDLLVVVYCREHRPDMGGLDDAKASGPLWADVCTETTGEQNRAACNVIHGGQRHGEPE